MKRKLLISKLFCRLLIMANLFFVNIVFSQSIGDYQSSGSGNWTDLLSWQRWSGSVDGWKTPTSLEGYPGQYSGTGAVLIQAGHTISIGNTGISTQSMGTITINGALNLNGDNTSGGINYIFDTQKVVITAGLTPTAHINFTNKVNLKLPTNAILLVGAEGLTGGCNNNVDIYIGPNVYAYCVGGGSSILNFADLMASGGTLDTTISPISPLCEGSTINLVGGISNTGWTILGYSWSITPPSGSTITSTNQNVSISNLLSGTYTASLTITAKYNSSVNYTNTETVSITVNAKPTVPELPSALNLSCSATGFLASWSASSSAISYSLDVATDDGFTNILPSYNNKVLGDVLSENVSGLTVGSSYYVRLRAFNGNCISNNSNTMVVSVPTTTYSGTLWNNGNPDSTKKVIFASNYSTTSQINACSCQINSGANVVFGVPGGANVDAILKIENELVVLGTLTFENNASLIQVNDAALNTGNIIYKRLTTPMKNFDFTYWCSPVKDQLLKDLSPNTLWDKYYSFDNGGWTIRAYGNAIMEIAKGYIVRVPKPQFWPDPTAFTYVQPVQFVGVPNNGLITIATQGITKDNLIGNPYPSALDADAFINANSGVIGGPLRFWTHNTAIAPSGNVYVYSPNDYVTYNLTGITVVTTGTPAPTGKIAAGQSFFVKSKAVGSFVYNNTMRTTSKVLASGSNSHFYRMAQNQKTAAVEKNRVWLNLTNVDGIFKQLLVGYITGATDGIDNLYDAVSLDGNLYADFYSINSGMNLVIQGRALPFVDTDQVPLGYRSTVAGVFSIAIDHTDGVLANQDIFIEDKVTGVVVNLKNGPYTFTTTTGAFNNRFVLRFMTNSNTSKITSKVVSDTVDKSLLVLVKNKQIYINSQDEVIDKVFVYDLKTSLLYEKENVNSKEFSIPNFNSVEQFLIVQVLLKNSKWITKEIIF